MESLPDVAIGATIALCGVLVAQLVAMIQSRLDREHQKHILLRTKYEELADQLNESIFWANQILKATTFDELHVHSQPTPARRAYMLTLLYFPLLKKHAEYYVEVSVSFQNVLVSQFRPLGGVTAGAQAAKHSPTEFQAAGETLRAAREMFDSEIEKLAYVYIKA